jgi:cysteine synthase A
MINSFNKNYQSIGNTPLVQISSFSNERNGNNLFAKVESRNPTFSIKDRIAYAMVVDALKSGALKENMEIIEPTSGNTGIALSMVGACLNFRVNIVMPETMSNERKKLIAAFGANLILTEGSKGMKGAIEKAEALIRENPGKYYMPDQFSNPSNPKIHEVTTGPEISHALDGKVDIIVAGVGTGGTITGISKYFKKICNKEIEAIAVEPEKSPAITNKLNNLPFIPSPHTIQGIGAGFIPATLDLSLVDEVITVSDEEALNYTRLLLKKEGISAGISSGAAIAGAIKYLNKINEQNKNVVVILPDTGERYLSTSLFL